MKTQFINIGEESRRLEKSIQDAILVFQDNTGVNPTIQIDNISISTLCGERCKAHVFIKIAAHNDSLIIMK